MCMNPNSFLAFKFCDQGLERPRKILAYLRQSEGVVDMWSEGC